MVEELTEQRFVLCIENKDCDDLEKRKIYEVLPDDAAAKEGYMRIIDESGEEVPNPNAGKKTHYYRIRHWNGKIMVVTEVPINRGYLNWTPQPDGSVVFTCDRCGGKIRLVGR